MVDTWKWLPENIQEETEIIKDVIKQEIHLNLAAIGFQKVFPKTKQAFWALPEVGAGFPSLQVTIYDHLFSDAIAEAEDTEGLSGAITAPAETENATAEQLQQPVSPPKVFIIPMKPTIITRMQIEAENSNSIFQLSDENGETWRLASLFGFILRENFGK